MKQFVLNPGPQTAFATSAADEALFGGGKKSGKTKVAVALPLVISPFSRVCMFCHRFHPQCPKCLRIHNLSEECPSAGTDHQMRCCGQYVRPHAYVEDPRFRCIVLRRHLPDLAYLEDTAADVYKSACPGVDHKISKHLFVFPHPFIDEEGAKVRCGYCEKEEHVDLYQGWSFQLLIMDEIGQWASPKVMAMLQGECYADNDEQTGRPWMKSITRLTANPLGKGHRWIVDRYKINDYPDGNVAIYDEETQRYRVYYHATVLDNPHVHAPTYMATLKEQSPTRQQAMIYGRWNVSEGSAFGEDFDENIHVIDKYDVPSGHSIILGGDWGYLTWGVVGVYSHDPDNGALVRLGEISLHRVPAREWPKRISDYLEKIGLSIEEVDLAVMDPSAWGEGSGISSSGAAPAEEMIEGGIPWTRANRDRTYGFQAVMSRLRSRVELPSGELIQALRIVRSRNPRLIETLPQLPQKEAEDDIDKLEAKKGNDGKGTDHWYDELRYVCATLPPVNNPLSPEDKEEAELQAIIERERRRNAAKPGYPGTTGYY